MGSLPPKLYSNSRSTLLSPVKVFKEVVETSTGLPLREVNTQVFNSSPITFDSFRTFLSQDLRKPLYTNPVLKQPLSQLLNHRLASSYSISAPIFRPILSLPTATPTGAQLPEADSILLKPSYSKLFRQSHLFFVHLLIRPLTASLDLLASSPYSDPTFSFNVFPDANLIKVSAFRRLNKQKSLYEARKDFFTSLTLPYLYKSHIVKREERPLELYPSLNLHPAIRTRLTPFYSSDFPYKNPLSLRKSIRQVLKVQRVRFKPGYGRIWRQARVSIREILNMPSRYQYRLTPKLQTHYTQSRQLLNPYSSLSLDYLLMASHLIPDF